MLPWLFQLIPVCNSASHCSSAQVKPQPLALASHCASLCEQQSLQFLGFHNPQGCAISRYYQCLLHLHAELHI